MSLKHRPIVVGAALAVCLALTLSACGRKAGPYAPTPDPSAPKQEPKLNPDGTRHFILDPLL
ncbi:hypothetical protein [Amorphus sp. 3PC139-8]|uniref:hypothetical protein n=1 Tax=Amorphus sp. 3PC139-8 TaxID=2735676 RepID=UPI00345D645E